MDRIEKIREYLNQAPNDNFLRHALALEYIKLGEDAKARELFEAILAGDPGYIGSYYHLAKLHERNEEVEQAIKVYERGMEEAKRAGENHAYSELRSAYEELIY